MKKEIFLMVLLPLFFLAACESGNNSSGKNTDWRTGTEGIVMSYFEDNPPSEVLSRSKVPVIVRYSNKGAYNVNDLNFYLSGYDPQILPFYSKGPTQGIDIGGKDQYNTLGSQEAFASWEAPKVNMNNLASVDNFKQTVTVTACYTYGTIANPTICIDPNQYETMTTKCTFDVKDLGQSQGGPIAVTEVKKRTTDSEIYLEIYFENKGGGTPFLPGINECQNLDYTEVNKIKLVKVAFSNGITFSDCKPSEIRLENNKGFAICSTALPSRSAFYETPLIIDLRYKYRQTLANREITIVNVNK
jgi:hypothetical protein